MGCGVWLERRFRVISLLTDPHQQVRIISYDGDLRQEPIISIWPVFAIRRVRCKHDRQESPQDQPGLRKSRVLEGV